MIPTIVAYGVSAIVYLIATLIGLHQERKNAHDRKGIENLQRAVFECTWETLSYQRSVLDAMHALVPGEASSLDEYNRIWKTLTIQMAALRDKMPKDPSQ